MPEKLADTNPPDVWRARQVELAIGQLESLSTLPCIAVRFLDKLLQPQFSLSAIADIIESDPALTAKILSLIARQGVSLADEEFSLRHAIDRLPAQKVRDALLSVKVLRPFDFDNVPDSDSILPGKELLLHNLAVACCAKEIAEVISAQIDSQMAYYAGLLHDIGKLALEETMPKSFARIIEQAKSTKSSSSAVEQKHLGADHTIFGKHLAQKWQLPNEITLAIWLHHSDTGAICENMPEARIAAVVQLADCIARQSGIGQSGSFDVPEPAGTALQALAISDQQLRQVRRVLPELVEEKSKFLGLDLPDSAGVYCDAIHTAVARLAGDNTKLSLENRRLQSDSSHLNFIADFLLSINSNSTAIDIAENFAVRWQKFYQTGTVCLYLAPPAPDKDIRGPAGSQMLEAVVVERLSQSKIVSLSVPEGTAAIPKVPTSGFAILDAHNYIDWLFEQLDVDFDPDRTKLVPLLSGGTVVGAIAFELHWPVDAQMFEESLKTSALIAGAVLDIALMWDRHQYFAEQFVRLISKRGDSRKQITPTADSLTALAEIAAGAAHELNNPLSVISGRAQLLANTETDHQKKEILKQIQENAGEASAIIEDLISFAEPPQPRRAPTGTKQILDEAIQLTRQKTGAEHINVQVDIGRDVEEVVVDSGQIVSAIANIITNAVESYSGEMGPIKITAETSGNFVRLQVKDLGCGMDAETLQKATQPFFSAKPAGRKRGMGLAYTARFLQLNECLLNIESEPGSGTTVTICLPRK
jgi:putative nucleotidyltransferase with HDIG domain